MRYILIPFLIIFFTACAQTHPNIQEDTRQKKLATHFLKLSEKITLNDAQKLAYKLLTYGEKLNKLYDRNTTPLFHNFLVNTGVKKRGLCWHFTYDIIEYANSLHVQGFDFYIAGANIDKYWSEHNSLLVTCKGCKFEKGILIDAWRNTNQVYFAPVQEDEDYQWSQRGGLQNDS